MVRRSFILGGLLAGFMAVESGSARADFPLFMTATRPDAVLEFDSAGNKTVFATVGLSDPSGLAFGRHGNLYVANRGDGTIREFSPTGADLGIFASGLSDPRGLVTDTKGDVFVSNHFTNSIREYSPTGALIRDITAPGLFSPYGLAFGPDGNLYVANPGQLDILKISPTGDYLGVYTHPSNGPVGLTFDSSGNLYVSGGREITEYGPGGNFLGFAYNGGLAPNPVGLAFGPDEKLYFANAGSTFLPGLASIARVDDPVTASFLATRLDANEPFLAFQPAPSAVPEPASHWLLALGGLALIAARRLRSRRA